MPPDPLYVHSCENCVFLGRAPWPENDDLKGAECDVYVCPQAGFPTVVMRYSDIYDNDYISGAHQVARLPPAMAVDAQSLMDQFRER